MAEILRYNELDVSGHAAAFERVVACLRRGDFRAAQVKKLAPTPYYRAELSAADRLLFRFATYGGRTYLLLLEIVAHHAYERSRFLNGAAVDESKLALLPAPEAAPPADRLALHYVNPERAHFHLLDKVLSFDDDQDAALHATPPLILIGTAGSGKTVLILEKLKSLAGDILYVTRSAYLAENSRNLYYAQQYDNERQNVDFLSFGEFLESLRVPHGRPLTFRAFAGWFARHRATSPIKDDHRLFEEFGGVLTGAEIDRPFLSRDDYLALGVRRSIFLSAERPAVYDLFEKYRAFLAEGGFYDANIEAHRSLAACAPRYDFVVVDEVQDLTNVQLQLALRTLRRPGAFILCGDSNQIVHPNFFSWTNVKTMFHGEEFGGRGELMRILNVNYRNSPQITALANRILRIKNARFGSVDRESNYLVRCHTELPGAVQLSAGDPAGLRDLNERTRRSARVAVMVMREEDKPEARRHFQTPLIFSVQEAKGLEYDSIILFHMVSGCAREFGEIAEGVSAEDLRDELRYARARDKEDKSLDAYKFFINALYVAVTRGVRELFLIERQPQHRMLALLGLEAPRGALRVTAHQSSADEWKAEAHRLELQGKQEQAEEIRRTILGQQPVPWRVLTAASLPELEREAFDPAHYNKQAKQALFEYAITYSAFHLVGRLADFKFNRAFNGLSERAAVEQKYQQDYHGSVYPDLRRKMEQYGVDFRNPLNQTPLMIAAARGLDALIRDLIRDGANPHLTDNWGRTPLQIALRDSFRSEEYARRHLGSVYPLLAPASLKVRVDGRLEKIDARRMEFFVLNSMIAIMQDLLRDKIRWNTPGFQTGDIVHALQYFPEHVIPAHRRNRQAITTALAGNECFREGPRNLRLFVRARRGYYIPNPLMEIELGDAFVNVYTLIGLEALAQETDNEGIQRFVVFLELVKADLTTPAVPMEAKPPPAPAVSDGGAAELGTQAGQTT